MNQEIYIPEQEPRNPDVLVPLETIQREAEAEFREKAWGAGEGLMLAMWELQKIVQNMGEEADLKTLIEDYPNLEGLLNLKGDFELTIAHLVDFLDKIAIALGLSDHAQLGVHFESDSVELE